MMKIFESTSKGKRFITMIAQTSQQKQAAFRMREKCFKLFDDSSAYQNDEYDEVSDHLITIDKDKQQVVGTYRLMRSEVAAQSMGLYGSTEFDLSSLLDKKLKIVELSRACIDPSYQHYNIISMLFKYISFYVYSHQYQFIAGLSSLPADPVLASNIFCYAKKKDLVGDHEVFVNPKKKCQVKDFNPYFEVESVDSLKRDIPPLMRLYFSLNTKIISFPALDKHYNVYDFYILNDYSKEKKSKAMRRFTKFTDLQ